jgi:DNA-binding transcriptional MocR family regulator
MAMLHAAKNGLEQQIASAKAVYRQRRDAMDQALHTHAPVGTRWTKPEGGMFFWVTAPEHIDTRALLATALEHNVAFVPGAAFHADGSGHNTMRLNFSLCDEAQIETGIARLCQLIADAAPASAVRTA